MSYFSHHVEEWDTIERKGIAKAMASMHPSSSAPAHTWSIDEFTEDLEHILGEMQCDFTPRGVLIWSSLCLWAQECISSEESAYFDGFVP